MRIEVVADASALALRGADIVCDVIRTKPDAVIGLPTGETPKATYAELVSRSAEGTFDAGDALAFAVDEFRGVRPGANGTNYAFFEGAISDIFSSLRTPDPTIPENLMDEYADDVKRWGGFELCVLGIGMNGHIAFNEPGSTIDSRARAVKLTDESRRAHADAFGSIKKVPRRGWTLGVADILESRAILVLAQGAAKASIVARAIEGPPTAEVPASWLQAHRDLTWLLDEAAASRLSKAAR